MPVPEKEIRSTLMEARVHRSSTVYLDLGNEFLKVYKCIDSYEWLNI